MPVVSSCSPSSTPTSTEHWRWVCLLKSYGSLFFSVAIVQSALNMIDWFIDFLSGVL